MNRQGALVLSLFLALTAALQVSNPVLQLQTGGSSSDGESKGRVIEDKTNQTKNCEPNCAEHPDKELRVEIARFFAETANNNKGFLSQLQLSDGQRKSTHFLIALVPDPVHTHLALYFDRSIEAIQQGAQESGWIFDRATMPWKRSEYGAPATVAEYQLQRSFEVLRESYPGLMVFRKAAIDKSDVGNAGSLLIWVVGEQPTAGVNKEQFWNALHLTSELLGNRDPDSLLILGPTFTGSLYSLNMLLQASKVQPSHITVFSGTVSAAVPRIWFEEHWPRFRAFQESDTYKLNLFTAYATKQGYPCNHIAFLSEDETAYGRLPDDELLLHPPACKDERITRLYFPREISQLRAAYQREVWTDQTSISSSQARPRANLKLDLEEDRSDDDSVPSYASRQLPLSQEAVLMSIVTALRRNHAEFVFIRATDPVDQLFLVRYLQLNYGEARLIADFPDLLFRREIDDSALRGVMAISPYPLSLDDGADKGIALMGPRIFPSSLSVGVYNATVGLLSKCVLEHNDLTPGMLPTAVYEYYQWPNSKEDEVTAPPLWLVALGRDGYWPLRILDYEYERPKVRFDKSSGPQALRPTLSAKPGYRPEDYVHTPKPYFVVCWIVGLLFLSYCVLLVKGSVYSSLVTSARFAGVPVNPRHPQRAILIATIGYIFLFCMLMLMWPWEDWSTVIPPVFGRIGLLILACAFLALLVWQLNKRLVWRRNRREAGLIIGGLVAAFLVAIAFCLEFYPDELSRTVFFHRYVHLTSGLSPLLPSLMLAAAILWWAWFGVAGVVLLDQRRPRLPKMPLPQPDEETPNTVDERRTNMFPALSQNANRRLMRISWPVRWDTRVVAASLILMVMWFGLLPHGEPRQSSWLARLFEMHFVQSLEGRTFDYLFTYAFSFVLLLLGTTLIRAVWTWTKCQKLLTSLDYTPFRERFKDVETFSWSPLMEMLSGALHDVERLLERQIERVDHLRQVLEERTKGPLYDQTLCAITQHNHLCKVQGTAPQGEYMNKIGGLQTCLAETCKRSLDFLEVLYSCSDWEKEWGAKVRDAAEEFVCCHYISILATVLGRIRTMVWSIGGIYVFLVFSLSVYPFQPRAYLNSFMFVLLVAVVTVVALMYAQMSRDPILSRVAKTEPGKLGKDFYFKLAGFIAIPLLSLLSARYPAVSNMLFSWVQPAIESVSH